MDAIELLTQDHRRVETLFADFERDKGDRRADILADLIRELSIHIAIEEAYVYPTVRLEARRGDTLIDEAEREHQRIEEVLARLDGKLEKAHTKDVADQVGTLKKYVMHHVPEEEREVFPALAERVSKTQLEEIGRRLRHGKETAPTRPHPNQPAATSLTAWANGLVDRARDRVAGRA